MGEVGVEKALNDYAEYMREVKKRVHVIQRVLASYHAGDSLTGYRESDFELCVLQLRKCLELVMLASLVAHFHSGVELNRRLFENEWNATKIMAYLKRKNSQFFPIPLNKIDGIASEMSKMEAVVGALTVLEFGKLYDQTCGKCLHASRIRGSVSNHEKNFTDVKDWLLKFVKLTNSHWIHVTEDLVFAVLMQTDKDGDVAVSILKKVD